MQHFPRSCRPVLFTAALALPWFTPGGGARGQAVTPDQPVTRPQVQQPATSPTTPETTPQAAPQRRNIRDRIGFNSALDRLGRHMPTGAGIAFGHVEGEAAAYRPALQGPAYDAVAFSLRSGPSEPSAHATQTARVIYGSTGLAPGVEVAHCMTTADFLTAAFLRADTPGPPLAEDPSPYPPRVFNHSWIGNPPEAQATTILRRVDHQIDVRDVVMCVGVNNGRNTPVPALLGSAHNAIAVGTTSGKSSGGYTTVETVGRCKPDIVAPNGMTSFTTPVVAACAALLLERGDALVEQGHAGANRSEVVKAALLGGAHKSNRWSPAEGRPLDEHLGAGEVNIDRALRILRGAPLEGGATIKRLFGWAAPALPRDGKVAYDLKLPVDTGGATFTAVWNRRIDGRTGVATHEPTGRQFELWVSDPRLADFDLRLISLRDGEETVLAESTSRIDNVELIHLPTLAEGAYRIELWRNGETDALDEEWDVAFTWAIDKPVRKPAPAPGKADATTP